MRRFAALAFFTLVATACGGGDSASEPTTGAPATSSTAAVTTTATVAPTTAGATTSSAPTTAAPAATTTTVAGGGEFATFGTGPPNRNWMQLSVRGGPSLEEEPELCLILNGGASGQIRSTNIGLDWSDDQWNLIWRNTAGTYDGPVEGAVDDITVTFHGEAGGMEVRGSIICYEA